MFTGMIIGANVWFLLYLVTCALVAIDRGHDDLDCRAVIIWVIIFSFVGGIIGYIFSFTLTILGYSIA